MNDIALLELLEAAVSLEEFEYLPITLASLNPRLPQMDLSRTSRLQRLRVSIGCNLECLDWFRSLMMSLPSPNILSHITVELLVRHSSAHHFAGLTRIDELLSTSQFNFLKSFDIIPETTEAQSDIISHMPLSVNRGILSFGAITSVQNSRFNLGRLYFDNSSDDDSDSFEQYIGNSDQEL